MYVRVCVCVGQTLLSYARGFPRGPKTEQQQQQLETNAVLSTLKPLCGGGVPSSHPSLGVSVFFLSALQRTQFVTRRM